MKKFKEITQDKARMRKIIIELASDLALIFGGIIAGYIFRAYIM